MTKTTTNVIGIIIVILAGIYFYVTYCSDCGNTDGNAVVTGSIGTHLLSSDKMLYVYSADFFISTGMQNEIALI